MPKAQLRDAGELLAPAVAETIAALDLRPEHAAAVKLAGAYARVIDSQNGHCAGCDGNCSRSQGSAWAMRWIAPLLLDCLESLGATPAARSRIKTGKPSEKPESDLQRFRAARGRRGA